MNRINDKENKVIIGCSMKRFLLISFLATLVGSLFAFEYNGFEYTVLEEKEGVSYVSVGVLKDQRLTLRGEVSIPERFTYNGETYVVTSIAENGFAYCNNVTSFTLPATITTIDGFGFYSCRNLTSITLNEGLRSIGNRALCNDSALVGTLVVPSTVDSIGDYAFGKCYKLRNIQFLSPTPAKVGGGQVFLHTIANARIMIPCGAYEAYSQYYYEVVYSMGKVVNQYFWRDKATDLCDDNSILADDKLRYRVIADHQLSVSGYIPYAIDGELRIPESVQIMDESYAVVEVDSNVFNGRELSRKNVRITSLIMPSSMRKINYAAFRNNHSLSSVSLNEGLEYIGNRAFCKDSLLSNITIPSTVTFLGDYAIGDIPGLQWADMLCLTLPASDGDPLAGVPDADKCDITVPCGTKKTNYNTGRWKWRAVDICEFNDGLLRYSRESAETDAVQVDGFVVRTAGALVIPSTVKAGRYQMDVTAVAPNAFSELNKGGHWLTSLYIPGTVRHIGAGAFRDCVQLKEVHFSTGLQTIGNRAFCRDSALTTISLPATVDSLGGYAFGICPNLSSIYAFGENPPKRQVGDRNPFVGCSAVGTLLVHCQNLPEYKVEWSGLLSKWTWGENCKMDIYHHNFPNAEGLLTECSSGDEEQIAYHRIFKPGQWETLYLPFDVESVTLYDTDDEEDVVISPWVKGVGGHFWLLKQSGNDAEGNPEFVTTNQVDGYTPYLIQFKNAWYADKVVTFHSVQNPSVETTFSKQSGATSAMFGNNTMLQQYVSGVYLLENDGATFQHSSSRRILYPFECYVAPGSAVSAPSYRFAVRYREVTPTENEAIPSISAAELLYSIDGNTLTIHTDGSAVRVYAVNGTLLQFFPEGSREVTIRLDSGYYIIVSQYGSQSIIL